MTENEPFAFSSTCTAVGEPKPVITWLSADGTAIPVQNQVPQFGVLTRADAGVFVCMAENSAGDARTQFTIIVQGSYILIIKCSDFIHLFCRSSPVHSCTCKQRGFVWSRCRVCV